MIYVSICIPTKDRLNTLKDTIESILHDNVPLENYQIVISDNSDNNDTEQYIKSLRRINIKYHKNPQKGFYNSVQSLLLGDGELLKLHNDYSKFIPGSFSKLVEHAKKYEKERTLLFFSNGGTPMKKSKKSNFTSFDEFMQVASYLTTWSSAFSIWRSDLIKMKTNPESVDIMFPHTTLLLESQNTSFKLINEPLFENSKIKNKGGYNIFYNFCILYLNMLEDKVKSRKITSKTYNKIKIDMLFKFIIPWYYRTIVNNSQGYTFDNKNADKNITIAYGIPTLLLVKSISKIKKIAEKIKSYK